jgi:hypothetical protein
MLFVALNLLQIFSSIQLQSWAIFDVKFERFRRVIAEIGLQRYVPEHFDGWEETIHGTSDWNLPICKWLEI